MSRLSGLIIINAITSEYTSTSPDDHPKKAKSRKLAIQLEVLYELQGFIHKKKSQDSQLPKKSLAWGEINVCQADCQTEGTS